jgi:hypothetical protein
MKSGIDEVGKMALAMRAGNFGRTKVRVSCLGAFVAHPVDEDPIDGALKVWKLTAKNAVGQIERWAAKNDVELTNVRDGRVWI